MNDEERGAYENKWMEGGGGGGGLLFMGVLFNWGRLNLSAHYDLLT